MNEGATSREAAAHGIGFVARLTVSPDGRGGIEKGKTFQPGTHRRVKDGRDSPGKRIH